MAEEIILGLTQGEITAIISVAVGAVLLLLLLGALLRLGAALMRFAFIVVLVAVFLFALSRVFN